MGRDRDPLPVDMNPVDFLAVPIVMEMRFVAGLHGDDDIGLPCHVSTCVVDIHHPIPVDLTYVDLSAGVGSPTAPQNAVVVGCQDGSRQ